MKNKLKKTQIFRHIIQLISLILIPGFYVLAFNEIKSIYTLMIEGKFNFINAFPSLIELTTVIIATILIGRFFCGWICSFGAYNDLVYFISNKVFKVNYKVDPKIDAVLKYLKYIVLVMIIIFSWQIGLKIFESSSPWDAFAQITDISNVLTTLTLGFILLILITVGAFFIERFFCRYLCPLGAIFTLISRISIFNINKPNDKCGKCRICTDNCTMGISLYKKNTVRGGECINCLNCVEVCPRKNTNANIAGENVDAQLASTIAIATFAGIYAFNTVGASVLTKSGISSNTSISDSSTQFSTKYKDGTYTGSASGFRNGTTTVSVTVSNGKITDVKTISNEDTPQYFNRVESTIIDEIISKQSTSVDTVSGATFSSRGIINAVKDALTNGKSVSDSSTESITQSTTENNTTNENTVSSETTSDQNTTSQNTTNETNNSSTTSESASTSQYKDGTYSGSANGFRNGITKVSVTVSNGKISSIETISSGDTPQYYDRAENTIIDEIISSQSTTVDTVSGATFSSNGIINAVKTALEQA